jgi:SpoVK/Ycf46/Vps4 family AAA+-type ATPase
MRNTVNQLLSELDGMESANENIFVLGATNHPWDIDVALRRPGRFDRTVLVLPPDAAAREVIFRTHLLDRPIASIDVQRLAALSDGLSGADIAHVCETAAEKALVDAMRSSDLRMIEMRDLEAALGEVRPSLGSWFETARNVVTFAGRDGSYDDLRDYMKKHKLL